MSKNLEIGAAYVRVSTDDQTELSPDAQVRVILDAAKADGYIIPEEYIFIEQKGISGRKAQNRPEFQRMIAVAKAQTPAPFQRLYLWKFSRFARNQEESVFYKSILRKKCGIEIKSVSEPIMDGMFGRLIESIIEWFDEYYSVNLSGEVLRGMTEKALRNGYQAVPSLGYNAVGNGKPFVVDEDSIQIVEYIHQSYYNGLDMTSIARECNRRGWRTRRGYIFERRTILRILTNRFYIGEVTWNGITFHGTHEIRPAIADVFESNQHRIQQEYHPVNRREVSTCKHWLSGLLKCSICGATLSISRSNNRKKRSDTFQCWKYLKGIHEGSNSISVRKAEIAVLDSLRKVIDTGEIEYEYIPKTDAQTSAEEAAIQSALSRLQVKEQRVRDAYENGIDSLEEYKENKLRLSAEKEELLKSLDQLTDHAPDVPSKSEVLSKIRSVYEILNDPDIGYEIKGNALRSVVKQITWNRAELSFHVYYYA